MKMRTRMAVTAMALCAASAPALQPGDKAPDFRAPSTSGKDAALADYAGRWLVLYFYPKSFTPGCTKQACSLRDGQDELAGINAAVLGASVDAIETQRKFKADYKLPFELLADNDRTVTRAYGVLAPGGAVANRVTFIIDPSGRIAKIFDKVNTSGHAAEVKAALDVLQKP